MTSRRRTALTSLATLLVGGAARAADPVPSLDLRAYSPPSDPRSSLYAESTGTPGPGNWDVGTWVSWSRDPIKLKDARGDSVATPVRQQISLDYFVSVGVGERLALRVALPTVLYQDEHVEPVTRAQLGAGSLPTTALGDAFFSTKATLFSPSDLGGFGLSALAGVTAPTGDPASYLGDGKATGQLRLQSELELVAIDVRASAGVKVRSEPRFYSGEEFGHDLPWGVAFGFKPQAFGLDPKGHWRWVAEARGALAITPSFAHGAQSPALAGVSARYTAGDLSAIAGLELPLNGAVGVPVTRAVLGVSWSPRFYDEDADGIGDDKDQCAELAEDKDGFEDADGCPDFDNDDDGVPDPDDQCPSVKEDEDEFQDEDGCPDLDDDGDQVPDAIDQCPREPAGPTPGNKPGCPLRDADHDGVADDKDQCKAAAEDVDGFKDDDGCPEPDNDGDQVLDSDDACPLEAGPQRDDAKLNGCPNPDKDGDTLDDAVDKCPTEPEDFDGVEDDDGCPDLEADKPEAKRGKPLVTVVKKGGDVTLRFRVAPGFGKGPDGAVTFDAAQAPLRALARELNAEPGFVVLVGVKPKDDSPEAQQEALGRSFQLALALRLLTHRDEVAETVGFGAVEKLPGARAAGIGFLVLSASPEGAPPSPVPAPPKRPIPPGVRLPAPKPPALKPGKAAPAPAPPKKPTGAAPR